MSPANSHFFSIRGDANLAILISPSRQFLRKKGGVLGLSWLKRMLIGFVALDFEDEVVDVFNFCHVESEVYNLLHDYRREESSGSRSPNLKFQKRRKKGRIEGILDLLCSLRFYVVSVDLEDEVGDFVDVGSSEF